MADVQGVVIDRSVSDWQIFQQNKTGTADMAVSGRWGGAPAGTVELRLVREDSSELVARHLDWQPAATKADGSWSAVLKKIPAGGLYRLETHLRTNPNGWAEWQMHGDVRHCLGVGDLWIIAGQSNSAGYGRGPCYDPPELGLHLFNNAMQWTLATHPLNESTDTAHPENREGVNSSHGPWIHFARLIRQQTNIPVGLVQVSLGGSPLSSWNPTDSSPPHSLYDLMMRVHKAVGGQVRGILWYQGESDTNESAAPLYADRFIAAVKSWRKAMKQPGLPVLTVQIGRWYDAGINNVVSENAWTLLREQQRLVPGRLSNVMVIPSLDLPLTDGIHVGPSGNMVLARRAAQAALATVYGRDVHHLAPEPGEIRATEAGRTLEITFRNVVGRMSTVDARANPFRVEDKEGCVGIGKIEYTNTPVVRLHLERALSGKAVVHGGYGCCPAVVPFDMDRIMPMLSFHGFPVQTKRNRKMNSR